MRRREWKNKLCYENSQGQGTLPTTLNKNNMGLRKTIGKDRTTGPSLLQ